jgi:hypothetical protein
MLDPFIDGKNTANCADNRGYDVNCVHKMHCVPFLHKEQPDSHSRLDIACQVCYNDTDTISVRQGIYDLLFPDEWQQSRFPCFSFEACKVLNRKQSRRFFAALTMFST